MLAERSSSPDASGEGPSPSLLAVESALIGVRVTARVGTVAPIVGVHSVVPVEIVITQLAGQVVGAGAAAKKIVAGAIAKLARKCWLGFSEQRVGPGSSK